MPSEEFADEEWDDEPVLQDSAVTTATATSQDPAPHAVRHIQRDYSYVRSELTRIAAMAAIIVLGLAVVAFLR